MSERRISLAVSRKNLEDGLSTGGIAGLLATFGFIQDDETDIDIKLPLDEVVTIDLIVRKKQEVKHRTIDG